MELPPFNNTKDKTIGVGFWVIQQFSGGKSV